MELVYQLYDVTTERFALWFPVFWDAEMPYTKIPKISTLHLAAFNEHFNMVCRFITEGKNIINYPYHTGMNALRWASLRGHYEVVRILLERGAD